MRQRRFFASLRMTMFSYELTCRECGWRTVCGYDGAVARLRIVGQLRREREPDEALVKTLFVEAAPQMTSAICKENSLFARPPQDIADKTESGQLDEIEPDHCPIWGALVQVRVSRRSGRTR